MLLKNFLNLLKRHRLPLFTMPIVMMVLVFLLTKNQPNVYVAKARIAAGIADGSQQLFLNKEDLVTDKVNQSFSNLLQILQLKVTYDQVSYQLILHDLTSAKPFRKPSKLLKSVNADARKHAIQIYTTHYNNHEPLSLIDRDQIGLAAVLSSMKYDDESIKKKLKLYRIESSDFIDLEYESDDAMLSAFVINTFCNEFITYYTSLTKQNELKALTFVNQLLQLTKDSLDSKKEILMNYKIKNKILNISEQSKSLYALRTDYKTKLETTDRDVDSYTEALKSINDKFSQHEKQYIESRLSLINKEIIDVKERLSILNDEYIKNEFNAVIKSKIDSLKYVLSQKINQSTDKYIITPLTTKENLVSQKLKLEIDLSLAQGSIHSLKTQIEKLNIQIDSLVPSEAKIQALEGEINVTNLEYLELLKKYNQVSLEYNAAIRLKQIEFGVPGGMIPSKKIVLIIVAGVVCFVLYIIILFVLFYLDDSIKVIRELEEKTGIKVLGQLPLLKNDKLDIQKLWDKNSEDLDDKEFRNYLRSTRFEIDNLLKDDHILVVTSLNEKEGKSLFCLCIASAYQMVGKKVLLIDGNFNNRDITHIATPQFYIEDYLSGKTTINQIEGHGNVSVLGNRGNEASIFEISSETETKENLLALKNIFDVTIIESPSLKTENISKEWILMSDKTVAVFESNCSINHEMQERIEYLKEQNGKFIGWVLNKVSDPDKKKIEKPKKSKKTVLLIKKNR